MLSLILFGLILLAGYLLFCLISPYRKCTNCNGSRRVTGSFNNIRHCTRCDSAGLQLRPGRKLITDYRNTRRHNRNRY